MASASTSESSPLLPSKSTLHSGAAPSKPQRSVTFSPTVSTSSSAAPSSLRPSSQFPVGSLESRQPVLSTLNSKLRRRNSHGGAIPSIPAPKIGPQRTTRTAQKLKLLPDPEHGEEGEDEESGRDVYSQYTRIKDPTARRDAARLGKADRERLPRVTAYCTASSYRMDDLIRFLKGKAKTRGAAPKLFDECIYSPYNYAKNTPEKAGRSDVYVEPHAPIQERRFSDSVVEVDTHNEQRREDLIDLHNQGGDISLSNGESSIPDHTATEMEQPSEPQLDTLDFDTQVHTPEVFLFNYGTVVIWGMTLQQEQRFLKEISKFEVEKLAKDDVQTEDFNFYYTREYQARIYNDFISLREKRNYMTKLAISHALAQSVKVILHDSPFTSVSNHLHCRHRCTKTLSTTPLSIPRTSLPRSPPLARWILRDEKSTCK